MPAPTTALPFIFCHAPPPCPHRPHHHAFYPLPTPPFPTPTYPPAPCPLPVPQPPFLPLPQFVPAPACAVHTLLALRFLYFMLPVRVCLVRRTLYHPLVCPSVAKHALLGSARDLTYACHTLPATIPTGLEVDGSPPTPLPLPPHHYHDRRALPSPAAILPTHLLYIPVVLPAHAFIPSPPRCARGSRDYPQPFCLQLLVVERSGDVVPVGHLTNLKLLCIVKRLLFRANQPSFVHSSSSDKSLASQDW